jgi:hypothetical protein
LRGEPFDKLRAVILSNGIDVRVNDALHYFFSAFMIFLSSTVLKTTVILLPEGLT